MKAPCQSFAEVNRVMGWKESHLIMEMGQVRELIANLYIQIEDLSSLFIRRNIFPK
jgi:hypothetical protein